MSLKNKVTAFGLSAAMLLSPAASLAESNYAAGELTTTAISDSYVAGNQLNLSAGFRLEMGDVVKSLSDEKLEKKLDAVVSLMEATELHMSFYDDFGTARIHAEIETDGLTIFSADALAYADGSVQMMTNLTGKLVLALPEGALASANFEGLLSGVPGKSADDPDFDDYPAMERLRITASDVGVLMLSHLLGWVSGTQMDTGELYVFDDTYLDATETRDAVAQRMVGTHAGTLPGPERRPLAVGAAPEGIVGRQAQRQEHGHAHILAARVYILLAHARLAAGKAHAQPSAAVKRTGSTGLPPYHGRQRGARLRGQPPGQHAHECRLGQGVEHSEAISD